MHDEVEVTYYIMKREFRFGDFTNYEIVKKLPSADAVPVVRCKDCIYYQDNNDGYPHDGCRWRSNETPDADDFCSMAERKDDESVDS